MFLWVANGVTMGGHGVLCVASGVTVGGQWCPSEWLGCLWVVALSLQVATVSPWAATVLPSSRSRAAPAQPHSPVPRCHHPKGTGVPEPPLCPLATPQPGGQVIPQPHIPIPAGVPCHPSHGDQRNLVWGAFFVLCHKAQVPTDDARGQGGLCPPPAPQPPLPLQGAGALFRIRLVGGSAPCAYLSPQDPRPLCHPAIDR